MAFGWAGQLVVTDTMISRYRQQLTGSYAELAPNASLADQDHVLDVAEELERGGAVSMFLFENMVTVARLAQQDRAIDRPSGLVLAPWQFAGIAPREFSGAGSEREITLVIAHSDAESATRNMTLLDQVLSNESSALMGRPWSEVLRLNSITATGDIVAAHLSGIEGSDPTLIVKQSFNSNSGFLVSE